MDISQLWLGTWSMSGHRYGRASGRDALATVDLALSEGIRCFDTAYFYGNGVADGILAKALGTCRSDVLISSKGGLHWDGAVPVHDASYTALKRDLSRTLEALKTDYLDVFYLHHPDPHVPVLESVAYLSSFQDEGLIRSWGLGNWTADQLSCLPSEVSCLHHLHFNPFFPAADVRKTSYTHGGIQHLATSIFEHGLLLSADRVMGKKDHRSRHPLCKTEWGRAARQKWISACQSEDQDPMRMLLAYALLAQGLSGMVLGARHPQQLAALLAVFHGLCQDIQDPDCRRHFHQFFSTLSMPDLRRYSGTRKNK